MSNRPWFPLYVGDMLADTMSFDATQFGGYMKILCHYWITQEPMSKDEMQIASGLSRNIFQKSWPLFEKKFVLENEKYFNRRMRREIIKASEISDKRSEAGRKGGEANAIANDKHLLKQLPTQLQSQLQEEHSVTNVTAKKSAEEETKTPTFWDIGKAIGIPGSVIGKACKFHTETAVAKAIAATQIKSPADPKSFFLGLLKLNPVNGAQEPWERMPRDNNEMVTWASTHGYRKYLPSETYDQYRAYLTSAITLRKDKAA